MLRAIGLVEFISIAKGIEAADAMLKAADVEILVSTPVCPGKYIVLVHGDVSAVESSVDAGVRIGATYVVDSFILPNVHPAVYPSITSTSITADIQALGILESFSIASMIVCADAALKAADVDAIELRLGTGVGGKSFFTLTGDVDAVKVAVEAGARNAIEKGVLVEKVVIPSPSKKLLQYLL
ncbi:BMC domain-containing protein [Clostridium bowmanii]|uniref:BMC domain-containing protein n=1 Tax=Clostridium bowmanii TaxID=132925 RepID=UPI001C0DB409|nr:BMC domain-containing protein [Clostridium bowmanii]MBU3191146.1 BMC domain-containing protein [Clostridium bowmanii]MCA1075537.1 BMC domain-containing protein [Clostridium bowmanii]